MRFAFFLAALLPTVLPPVIALAAKAQSDVAVEIASPTRLGGGILPADRDASANWRMAGMLSVGGIPNRTTVCASISPLGESQDDTANIQKAIQACPLGQVVLLAAGMFTVGDGHYILLNRGVTLRGAGPGDTHAAEDGRLQASQPQQQGLLRGLPYSDDHRGAGTL